MADNTSDILNKRKPEQHPDDKELKEIRTIYSSLVTSVKGSRRYSDKSETIEGPLKTFSIKLDRLKKLTGGRDYSHFMPDTRISKDGKRVCYTKDLYAQKDDLLGELKAEFLPDEKQYFEPASQPPLNLYLTNFNSQVLEVNHKVEVQVTNNIKVNLAARLDDELRKHPTGSKEHKFMTKLRDGLNSAKDFAGLTGLVLTTAQSVGVDYDKLHLLLKGLGLI